MAAIGLVFVISSSARPSFSQTQQESDVAADADASAPSSSEPIADAAAETDPPVAGKHELLRKYVLSTLGPSGMLSATIASEIDQVRDKPGEWDQGGTGYAKRWASEFGKSAINDTTKYAVSRLLHQDPSYTRCACIGFGPRLGHALGGPFTARKRDGRRVVSPAIAAGLLAEHVVATSTWYPAEHGARDGLTQAAVSLGSKMVVDVVKEFVRKRR